MRGLNLAVLIVGLTLVGVALYGFAGMDGSLKLAASRAQPAPSTLLEEQAPPCRDFTPGV